jgi:hypothetical protein
MDEAGWGPSRDPSGWASGHEVAWVTTDAAGNFESTFKVSANSGKSYEVTAVAHPTYGVWLATVPFQIPPTLADFFFFLGEFAVGLGVFILALVVLFG